MSLNWSVRTSFALICVLSGSAPCFGQFESLVARRVSDASQESSNLATDQMTQRDVRPQGEVDEPSGVIYRGQSPYLQPMLDPWITVSAGQNFAAAPVQYMNQSVDPYQSGPYAPMQADPFAPFQGAPYPAQGMPYQPMPGGMGYGAAPYVWNPYLAGSINAGSERTLGEGQLVVPLFQDGRSLLFADLRGHADDSQNYEGNLGLVYRSMIANDLIHGAYIFYDNKTSENDNNFSQITLGLETMSTFWEARANGYIPLNGGKSAPGATEVSLVGNSLVMQGGREQPYYGLDGEIGFLVSDFYSNVTELRAFIGGYHFDTSESGFESITGPRGRLELRMFDLPALGADSRVTLGVDLQWDQVRDTQVAGSFRVVIPFGYRNQPSNDRFSRRMLDRVVRDVDIVTQARATGPKENTIDVDTGRLLNNVSTATVAGNGNLNLGTGDTVFVSGNINQANPVFINGQQLIGGGTRFQVRGVSSGQIVTTTAPGAAATINGTNVAQDVIHINSNSGIRGVNITGGRNGILSDNNNDGGLDTVTNVLVAGNTISGAANNGLRMGNLDAATRITGNSFTQSGQRGLLAGTNSGTISGNQAISNGTDGIFVNANTGMITGNTSTGNVGHGFAFAGNNSGVISANTASGNGTGASGGHGFVMTGTNSGIVSGNMATGNGTGAGGGSGYLFGNANAGIISGNVATGNGAGTNGGDGFTFAGGNNAAGRITGNIANSNGGDVNATALTGSGFSFGQNRGAATGNNAGIFSDNSATGNFFDGFTIYGNNTGTMNNNVATSNLVDGFYFSNLANGDAFDSTNTGMITGNIATGNGFTNGVPTMFTGVAVPPNPGDGFDGLTNAAGGTFSNNASTNNAGSGFNAFLKTGAPTLSGNTASGNGNAMGNTLPQ
ncbi:hypothetical protein GC163_05320 [bacterium]|nr:hypothetical protein [bacterium]